MIEINTTIKSNILKIWDYYTNPEHIINWNFASDDWHCPKAENDLYVNKKFSYTMASKDGQFSFDFEGEYTEVIEFKEINYKLLDDRKINIRFIEENNSVIVNIKFDPEQTNSEELQKSGWQTILNNFKKYVDIN